MRSVTVLGCGLSGMTFARKLRELDPQAKIILVDKSPVSFNRWQFFEDLSFKSRFDAAAFAKEIGAEFICDTVERINHKRKKIYFKDKECRDYQELVVAAGAASKKIAAKGEHREGFYYLSSIDLLPLRDRLKMATDVAVLITTRAGLTMALNLKAMGKEVSVVMPSLDILCAGKDAFLDYCRRENIAFYEGYNIEEAIGEATVRAVKLNPLKIIAAQVLLLDTGFIPNTGFFDSDGPEGIDAKGFSGVSFIGDAADSNLAQDKFFVHNRENAVAGALAAAGGKVDFTPKSEYNSQYIIDSIFTRYNVNPVPGAQADIVQ